MSTEVIEQREKRKGNKKSYDEIKTEFLDAKSKVGYKYIPWMCEALKEENPEWTNQEIQGKIYFDLDGEFVHTYIRDKLPSWVHDDKAVKRVKKAWETRNASKLDASIKKIEELSKIDIPVPHLFSEDLGEGEELGEPLLESYGGRSENLLTLYSNIKQPCQDLFRALTNKELPGLYEDIILDYIKPSREFRKGIIYDIDESMRVGLYNALTQTDHAIHDMLKVIDEVNNDKQKKKGSADR